MDEFAPVVAKLAGKQLGTDGARPQVPLRSAGVERGVRERLARHGAQDGGPRLLDAVHARPLHRHAARADGRDLVRGRGDRAAARRACSCSATTTSTRPSPRRRPRPIDLLSDGRLELGIGAGWMQTDYDALGMPYDSAGTRIERLDEALAGHQGLLGRRAVRLRGDALHDHRLRREAQARAAAAPADPHRWRRSRSCCSSPAVRPTSSASTRTCGKRCGHRRRHQERARRRDPPEDRLGARRRGRPLRRHRAADPLLPRRDHRRRARPRRGSLAPGFGITGEEALDSGVALVGTVDEVCDRLVQRRDEWGVSFVVVGEDTFEAFAPVVARLAGT